GIEVETIEFGKRAPVDPTKVVERLAADKAHDIKAVLFTHVDTASSTLSDTKAVRAAMDEAGHPALFMADCIASLACDRFEMADAGVDVMVAGSQKGLMTPPGMCFVFYNAKADARRDTANCATGYWDWRPRTDAEALYLYFYGTAPTHHLYGLREALDMILEEGLEEVYRRHEVLAEMVWIAGEAWSSTGPLALNISDRAARSRAVTTFMLPQPQTVALRAWTEKNTGVTLGLGLGMDPDDGSPQVDLFRIGHMGHLDPQMLFGALSSVDSALKSLQIPHGSGALEQVSEFLAYNGG
ncbi:MAG: aminotransferase class V-fold PLP-dependent enzyme, partial [Pseudomonadota bacterium]